ncbi:hypothetical protein [Denitratisoma oestradiolicum]|nr:hypothetical protein [Denitratisoma oestradiolicum]
MKRSSTADRSTAMSRRAGVVAVAAASATREVVTTEITFTGAAS